MRTTLILAALLLAGCSPDYTPGRLGPQTTGTDPEHDLAVPGPADGLVLARYDTLPPPRDSVPPPREFPPSPDSVWIADTSHTDYWRDETNYLLTVHAMGSSYIYEDWHMTFRDRESFYKGAIYDVVGRYTDVNGKKRISREKRDGGWDLKLRHSSPSDDLPLWQTYRLCCDTHFAQFAEDRMPATDITLTVYYAVQWLERNDHQVRLRPRPRKGTITEVWDMTDDGRWIRIPLICPLPPEDN